mgnify:CR=1 FL=1
MITNKNSWLIFRNNFSNFSKCDARCWFYIYHIVLISFFEISVLTKIFYSFPIFVIFNVGISKSFLEFRDLAGNQFPSKMDFDVLMHQTTTLDQQMYKLQMFWLDFTHLVFGTLITRIVFLHQKNPHTLTNQLWAVSPAMDFFYPIAT